MVAARSARHSACTSTSRPLITSWRIVGSSSAQTSRIRSRKLSESFVAATTGLLGPSPDQRTSCWPTRSITPVSTPSSNSGRLIASGFAPSRSPTSRTQRAKSAPGRSSLLTNTSRGTPWRSACRHTVSVCGSTPATPSSTTTAPSRTRSDRSTSIVKSTWPGVSIRWMRWSCQSQVTAAARIVMPLRFSMGWLSVRAVPSWTSPIVWMRPVWNSTRSVSVVLPASTCAMMPMLRMRSMSNLLIQVLSLDGRVSSRAGRQRVESSCVSAPRRKPPRRLTRRRAASLGSGAV